jgi:inner membrane protein
LFILIATASHGLLDMVTNGGKGVAFLWPVTSERFFFPMQVIAVAPLSVKRLFGPAGLPVLVTELQWIWLPALLLVMTFLLARRWSTR